MPIFPRTEHDGYNSGHHHTCLIGIARKERRKMRIRNWVARLCVAGLFCACGCGDQSPPKASPAATAKSSVSEKTNGQPVASVARNSDEANATSSKESPKAEAEASGDIIVAMEDCKASRPGKITGGTSILKLL